MRRKLITESRELRSAWGVGLFLLSGRGLGFSGGTLDKMESIPGYRTNLTTAEFLEQLGTIGLVLTGQSADLAPADGKLYALRDVTGTVPSIPLIASSVMSKKIAAGAQKIVLDVKLGLGAFMPTLKDARKLAKMMVAIADLAERQAVALLSDMNQPLGCAVGNALELQEAIDTLHGNGPDDFREHCLVVAGHMLALGQKARDEKQGRRLAEQAIADGRAWERFRQLVQAQGGDVRFIDEPQRLPKASIIKEVRAARAGYLSEVNARIVGETCVALGGGRAQKSDVIDYAVGIVVHCKVGDHVAAGKPLFTVHANDPARLAEAEQRLEKAVKWLDMPVPELPLFYDVIR